MNCKLQTPSTFCEAPAPPTRQQDANPPAHLAEGRKFSPTLSTRVVTERAVASLRLSRKTFSFGEFENFSPENKGLYLQHDNQMAEEDAPAPVAAEPPMAEPPVAPEPAQPVVAEPPAQPVPERTEAPQEAPPKRRGRPPGSKNKPKPPPTVAVAELPKPPQPVEPPQPEPQQQPPQHPQQPVPPERPSGMTPSEARQAWQLSRADRFHELLLRNSMDI